MSAACQDVAIEIQSLAKSYRTGHLIAGRKAALCGLSLEILRGEIFGFLGPNGSGKTTTLKILTGLMRPDAGYARILGTTPSSARSRARVGYLPENPYFYDYLTAREYLDYVGRLFGLERERRRERVLALLDLVGLQQAAGVSLRRFSKGMVQRLGLAQALMNDPAIVLLDEPMSGLDPIGRRLVREVIIELKRKGKTVFFSTHILSDAEALCDRVALLNEGRLIEVGALSEILDIDVSLLEMLVSGGRLDQAVPSGVRAVRALGERWRLEINENALLPTLRWAQERGGRLISVQPVRRSLEERFFGKIDPRPGSGPWMHPD